ncbi:DNA-binding protein [Mycobacterium sp.]|uniref:MmyB family transcriptional regulator n=1 Tax=Mycobacterium sp. TaxID=1785 RepID=UPI00333E45DC
MRRLRSKLSPTKRGFVLRQSSSEISAVERIWRAAHNVRLHRTGAKRFHHPAVGDLNLTFEVMELSADTGLTLTAYSAEPDTPSHDGLTLLADGKAIKIASMIDEHTRLSLLNLVERSITAERRVAELT